MKKFLLVQLPIPQLNFGRQTGNVPLGAAYLKQAATKTGDVHVEIVPESISSYICDTALIDYILSENPDVVGFTVYSWNVERSLYAARILKRTRPIKIIFGGPEITPGNTLASSSDVDFSVYGEGESVFPRLIRDPHFWRKKSTAEPAEDFFRSNRSPYLQGFLEPEIENMVLLETQRGCPYRCGYCYYNKARNRVALAEADVLIETVQWAVDHRIPELYLLDPCLNARPDLKGLLSKIRSVNRDRSLGIISEIRAEAIDAPLADLFAEAGFTWFEIGLQSTNPKALALMNRPTNLNRFLEGANHLKEREILPRIDLIVGLPGDDLEGFKKTVDYVADHDLADDAQVFPLSVLPGTDFRRNNSQLGLFFDKSPPYRIDRTTGFSAEDMLLAFDYAESRFDLVLYPMPFQDLSFRSDINAHRKEGADIYVYFSGRSYVSKIYLSSERPESEVKALAKKLTSPYQVFVHRRIKDPAYLQRFLKTITSMNPFTPFEMVFLEPERSPDRKALLSAVRLKRPHYLDGDLRYLFPRQGNRAVLFTLVSQDKDPRFAKEMERQIYWWKGKALPELSDLNDLTGLDGVLIDAPAGKGQLTDWQDRFVKHAEDVPFVSFPDVALQKRWLFQTAPNDFSERAFNFEQTGILT
jgi:radical SAM superfamily enzyme YgiQ (UPF0313 family)